MIILPRISSQISIIIVAYAFMENEYIPPETPTTTTTPVVTTTTPLIPYTHQARVNVSIKLTSAVYTTDLAIKTSDAYKSLKTKVVDTVILTVSVCVQGCHWSGKSQGNSRSGNCVLGQRNLRF